MKFVNLRNDKCNTKSPNAREWEKYLLVESGILGFGIRNSAQGIRKSRYRLKSGIQSVNTWSVDTWYMSWIHEANQSQVIVRLDKSGLDNFLGFRELFRKQWIKVSPCELEFFPITSLIRKALPAPHPPPPTHTHTLMTWWHSRPVLSKEGEGEGVKRLSFERTS